jgi:MFS family permease
VLLAWRRPVEEGAPSSERFVPALRAGGRYIRHDPITRRILLRLGLFVAPATAIWALLPLVASRRLGMAADGYGLLLGALGAGAVAGALLLPRIQARLSANQLLGAAALAYAAAMVVLVVVQSRVLAVVALLPAGAGWIAVIASTNAEIQLFLPVWVRARGLATYQMVLFGSQAIGALAWGLAAQYGGLVPAFFVAAGAMVAGAATIRIWPLFDTRGLDRQPSSHWPEPNLTMEPEPGVSVLVTTRYTVAAHLQQAFLEAMRAVRLSRLRTGAISWALYREGETANRFVEVFTVPTWEEHLRQHHGRLTGADATIEAKARVLSDPPLSSVHLFPADPG